jgi:cell division protein FtsB
LRLLWTLLERAEGLRAWQQESRARPAFGLSLISEHRRKLATIAMAAVAILLAFHVVFGTNGMVAYGKKRAEHRAVQLEVERLERENQILSERNRSLKSDPGAIEREAREQLRYAKPGEVILIFPEGGEGVPAEATARPANP